MFRGLSGASAGLLLGALTLSVGCPEPLPGPADAPTTGSDGNPAAAGGANQPPTPTNGQGAPDGGGNDPNDARWKVTPGDGVKLSGTFVYEGDKTGSKRIDFQTRKDNQPPRLAHTLEVGPEGTWEVEVPKDAGAVFITAFLDQGNDGPSQGDPIYVTPEPIMVASDPVAGVELKPTDDGDMGALRPRSPDAGGEGAPEISPPPKDPSAEGAPVEPGTEMPPPEGEVAHPSAEPAPDGAQGG